MRPARSMWHRLGGLVSIHWLQRSFYKSLSRRNSVHLHLFSLTPSYFPDRVGQMSRAPCKLLVQGDGADICLCLCSWVWLSEGCYPMKHSQAHLKLSSVEIHILGSDGNKGGCRLRVIPCVIMVTLSISFLSLKKAHWNSSEWQCHH